MTAAVLILSVICILLTAKIYTLKKSAKEIENQSAEILNGDTNRLITLSSRDRRMRRLAVQMNDRLDLLRQNQLRYESGDKELKRAITNISHDLRTPLTAILGYTEMAKKEDDPEKVNEYLSVIEGSSMKMKELTEELFIYSTLNAEKELNIEKTDIRAALEESIAENYVLLTDKNIVPEIIIPGTPVIKNADVAALQRVFSNIISNAAKYSDGDLSITMDENGKIIFSNTAKRISVTQAGRLFDRFFTVEDGRSSTGLGLSIAKGLTEKMGGKISAEYDDNRLSLILEF